MQVLRESYCGLLYSSLEWMDKDNVAMGPAATAPIPVPFLNLRLVSATFGPLVASSNQESTVESD